MTKKIKILYEDKDILAIDKPSGISVHPDGRNKEKTITDWVQDNYPKMKNVGEPMGEIKRPGIVHRLDKDTSGVLILAKNQKTYEFLKTQFQDRKVKKIYHAIVSGFFKEDHGVVNKPIGRSPSDFRRHLAGRGARGELREAVTEYKVLNKFESQIQKISSQVTLPRVRGGTLLTKKFSGSAKGKFSYLEIYPKTGRTHQIRVHMKYLSHPVACDSLYDPDGPCPKDFSRMALHAKSIEFKDPKGKTIKVESNLPKEFKQYSVK
jgi:23S rRNA pseudouridine1911/1915/1917 synthase